jgi:endonuclease/exonuclease/phosphatase (EEP) superfamily protein YafD
VLAHDRLIALVLFNSATYYVYWPAWIAGLVAWRARQRAAVAFAGAVIAAQVGFIAPDFIGRGGVPAGALTAPRIRVITANVFNENSDLESYLIELRESRPDIVVVQEFTSRTEQLARELGLERELPYTVLDPRDPPATDGNAIYSRYALSEIAIDLDPPMIRATVDVRGQRLRIFAIHPLPPGRTLDLPRWNREYRKIVALADAEPGRLIIAGDFNATQHNRWHRDLTRGRLADAHRQCGRGSATTWPGARFSLASLFWPGGVRVDHILISDEMRCLEIREGRGAGSDHRPVIADIAILE